MDDLAKKSELELRAKLEDIRLQREVLYQQAQSIYHELDCRKYDAYWNKHNGLRLNNHDILVADSLAYGLGIGTKFYFKEGDTSEDSNGRPEVTIWRQAFDIRSGEITHITIPLELARRWRMNALKDKG